MKEVEFIYEERKIIIQCNENDLMKDICKRFASKLSLEMDSLFFIYGGEKINLDLTFINVAKTANKEANKISIIVYENKIEASSKNELKMKEVICPKCGENARLKITNYKINLFDCKNRHNINNILLKDYEKTQNIDISKIICNNCKIKNKANCFNNEFYKCCSCGMNLCPLCKSIHDKSHKIINYDKKNYICYKHLEYFTKYCNQ
jgi:hypothetical protein